MGKITQALKKVEHTRQLPRMRVNPERAGVVTGPFSMSFAEFYPTRFARKKTDAAVLVTR